VHAAARGDPAHYAAPHRTAIAVDMSRAGAASHSVRLRRAMKPA